MKDRGFGAEGGADGRRIAIGIFEHLILQIARVVTTILKTSGIRMPTISSFYGVVILMFYEDHSPPHFHARYAGDQALFSILDLTVIQGKLPPRATRLVLEWAADHQSELMENWTLCATMTPPNTIPPLR